MDKITEKLTAQVQLKGIELLEVGISPPPVAVNETITYTFELSAEHRFIPEQKSVLNLISVAVIDAGKQNQLGLVKVLISFEIADFDKFMDKEKSNIILPEPLLVILNSISISTLRGIMFAQFRGTHLHNAFLPIIDPKSLKKKSE